MDVVSLKQFYSSPLGQNVARFMLAAVRRRWGAHPQDSVLGLGFTMPCLDALRSEHDEVYAFMPAQQGAIFWPADANNASVMVQEDALPLQDASVNRIICTHLLEHSKDVSATLEEIWHVLKPSGRALVMVPQRRSFWSHSAATPFGFGQPFSLMQLHELVTRAGFTYVGFTSALYAPPVRWRWMLRCAGVLETLGRILLPGFGGVIVMEVEKQIYATVAPKARAEMRGLFMPLGAPAATVAGFQRTHP